MSFYSYKNANAECSPGVVNGNILTGLNQRVCIQVKNVYDSALSQEQLEDKKIVVTDIVPVLPGSDCKSTNAACRCTCEDNRCTCSCRSCGAPITHEEAVENAENSARPLPQPCGQWTFESCRSSTTKGRISNLSIERMCDRPQFARVRCGVEKDVLLCIPDDSIIPFTLESLVSAICVSGSYIGDCTFQITLCVTIVLKVLAEVDIMVPTYGFCQVPPAEEFAENVCDEFFSLPLFPQSSCATDTVGECTCASGGCGAAASTAGANRTTTSGGCSTCSSCGTTCAGTRSTLCPRCGSTMTTVS